MKRKIVMLALVAVLALSACGRSNRVKNNGGNKSTSAENINGQEFGNAFKIMSYKSARDVEGVSDKYVDFDNMSFAYHGKLYTLGKSTLQDLIDDGTEDFNELDKSHFDDMVEPGEKASWPFNPYVDPYVEESQLVGSGLRVDVYNPTDKSMPARDCVLCFVYFNIVAYPPLNRDHGDFMDIFTDEEENKQFEDYLDRLADEVRFSFPYTLQEDELTESFPEYEREFGLGYNEILYMENEDFGYRFEFDKNKDNRDQLMVWAIYWLPQ